MTLYLLAFAAGVLTLLSPCILPVLPFVLSGSGQPFRRGALPLLIGLAGTFALVASLAAFGGGWTVRLGEAGRWVALIWLAGLGLALLVPAIAARLTAPLVQVGERMLEQQQLNQQQQQQQQQQQRRSHGVWSWSLMTGVATGFVWAPCAGPVLGLVLTSAALNGPQLDTTLQLLAFGLGAGAAIAVVTLAGRRVLAVLRQASQWVAWPQRALGVLILASVAALALGVSEQALLRLPSTATNYLEERMIDLWMASPLPRGSAALGEDEDPASPLAGLLPTSWWGGDDAAPSPSASANANALLSFDGATRWLNGPPPAPDAFKGKVVVVNFWTYSCINCLRTLPFVRAWQQRYAAQGLMVVGVHTPEFAFEKDPANVARAARDLKLAYPVAQDNDYRIWRTYNNRYWPAVYVIDAKGRIRHQQFGEGGEDKTEQVIRTLLREQGQPSPAMADTAAEAQGVGLPADLRDLRSPESYIGYAQATSMVSPERLLQDAPRRYSTASLGLNEWALSGQWTVGPEFAELNEANGGIAVRFHARDLHLVMGAAAAAGASADMPLRLVVTIDGHPPGAEHGVDVDAQGNCTVTGPRLYQLVRQREVLRDRQVEIRFLSPGVRAYAFTFG